MANFGLRRLTVVSEHPIDLETARPLAIGAESVLEGAGRANALSEAVRASSLVVGVTRRIGEKRKGRGHAPWEVAAKIREHPEATVSLVFGNEHAGLSDEELTHCHLALSIPTSSDQPSLNLSQAVGIVCYELYSLDARFEGTDDTAGSERRNVAGAAEAIGVQARTRSEGPPPRDRHPVDGETLEESISAIMESLEHMGYRWHAGPRGMRTVLRDLLARAVPTYEETRRVRELFAKLAGLQRGGR
jgi:TrmH family RNA methyltransferase